jgi:DHA1 family bicyclomycin/chloramphenicol resistance-like MFS transporter
MPVPAMPLKTDSAAFVVLLAALTAVGPLSVDIYLPSLPAIAASLHTSPAGAEATITGYFIGFAVAQILHGPVSDRVGRRPVLLVGLACYSLAALACVLAPSISTLVAARVVQAVAAAAPIIVARTIVRDMHSGVTAGRLFSLMASITGLAPIIAPLLGGLLQAHFGWQSNFVVMAVLGAAAFGAVLLALPETLRQKSAERLTPGGVLVSFRHVFANPRFRVYASVLVLAYGGLFTYIGVSSFIVQDFYRLSPIGYGVSFALGAGFFIGGTFLGRRVAQRAGLEVAIGVGVALLAIGGVVLPFAVAFGPRHILSFFVPMAVFQAGIGVTTPQALAAAMTPFPDRAGAASSLAGFMQMAGAAILLGFTGAVFGASAALQASVVGAAGLAAFAVYVGLWHARHS